MNPKSPSYWTHPSGCPRLFLAPMEGLGDHLFRRAIRLIGGFDEACTPFISVPTGAHVRSIAKRYDPSETLPAPQAAQVMGSDPQYMAAMAAELERRGAPRVDLNCGCPSNTVTGKGSGSSLLKDPEHLYSIAKAIREAISIPMTVKLRSGYADHLLFDENMRAAQEAGADFISLHPRTKIEGYKPPAHWHLIARAKEILDIPVVGSGDVVSVPDALRMLKETGCDGIMIGRGAVSDPWIFHDIKAHFCRAASPKSWEQTAFYLQSFLQILKDDHVPPRTQINKLKQMIRYLFRKTPEQQARGQELLRGDCKDPDAFLNEILDIYQSNWTASEPPLAEIAG